MRLLSQTDYAAHRGVSQPRIHQLIKSGHIPENCIKKKGRYKVIDVAMADAALERNLDRLRNPNVVRTPKPTKKQLQALRWAGKVPNGTPSIIETLRYLVKLHELNPDEIDINFPGPGEDGVLITYTNAEDPETPYKETIFVNIILNDPAEFQEMAEDEGLPAWAMDQYQELKARLNEG